MPNYRRINSKPWKNIGKLRFTPNVQRVVTKMLSYGNGSIVPAREIMHCFSCIEQVNKAFINMRKPYRLRIVQSRYDRSSEQSHMWPNGCLVQLAQRVAD